MASKNHQPRDCLPNRLFRHRWKKTSKLCVTGLCVGNSPVTGEFPAQRASNAENVSIWWRHHCYVLGHLDLPDLCLEWSTSKGQSRRLGHLQTQWWPIRVRIYMEPVFEGLKPISTIKGGKIVLKTTLLSNILWSEIEFGICMNVCVDIDCMDEFFFFFFFLHDVVLIIYSNLIIPLSKGSITIHFYICFKISLWFLFWCYMPYYQCYTVLGWF